MVITIDGPAGAGKSTIARKLAHKLGFQFLESGSLYRALTFKIIKLNQELNDRQLTALVRASRISFKTIARKLHVFLDGRDVTQAIRDPQITNNVYKVANNPQVRRALISIQRSFADKGNLVAEGRDMGSVVFPNADIKFYLDASLTVRAERRYHELLAQNVRCSLKKVRSEIKVRDIKDQSRKVAPLIKPKDAVYVDTSDLTIDQVLNKLLKLAR